jgi:hypothetical protein
MFDMQQTCFVQNPCFVTENIKNIKGVIMLIIFTVLSGHSEVKLAFLKTAIKNTLSTSGTTALLHAKASAIFPPLFCASSHGEKAHYLRIIRIILTFCIPGRVL